MTDLKNNLEEVWKEKMSIDMSSPIKFLRTMRLSHYEIPSDFMLDMHDQLDKLEQELQKTREQLEKAAVLMKTQKDCIDHLLGKKESFGDKSTIGFGKRVDDFLDKYFKDKQGEGKRYEKTVTLNNVTKNSNKTR